MKVIKPIRLTKSQYLYYSNTDAGDYPAWSVATAYAVGDRVSYDGTTVRRQYECLVAHTGSNPTTNPTKWVDIGGLITWRPFDGYISSAQAVTGFSSVIAVGHFWGGMAVVCGPDLMSYELEKLGSFDAVAVLGTDCGYVRVKFFNQDGTLTYDQTQYSVDQSNVIDAWTYCFSPQLTTRNFIFEGIDGWGTTQLSQLWVEIGSILGAASDIPVSVGEIVMGDSYDLGECHADAKVQLQDYSKKSIDAYGTVTIVQRAYSYNGSFEVEIAEPDRARVQGLIASLRATPCVWYPAATDASQGVVIYGYPKEFEVTYQTPERAYASLEIEGMI